MLGKVLMGMSDFEEALKELTPLWHQAKQQRKHASCARAFRMLGQI